MRMHAAAVAAAGILLFGAAGCASTTSTGAGGPPGSSGPAGSTGSASSAGSAGSGVGANPSGTTTGPSIGGPASSPPPTGEVVRAAAASCPTDSVSPLTNPAAKPVPADIQVAWVLRCRVVPGNGSYTLVAERSISDPTDLVRALREASVPRAKVVCPMLAVYMPNFALVQTNGKLLVPRVPLNNCGMAQNDVVIALNQLRFVQISSHPVK
jgi:hypothetical protein